MGAGGHRSRGGQWGDTGGDGNQQQKEDDGKYIKKRTKKVLRGCGRPQESRWVTGRHCG